MHNQIHSYSFPLAQGFDNSYISPLKSKGFLIASSNTKQQRLNSNFTVFKYQQQSPKKSSSQNINIKGSVYDLISSQIKGQQICLAITKNDQFKIQLVFPQKINSSQNQFLQCLQEQQNAIYGLHFKKDAKQFFYWEEKAVYIFDLQKKAKKLWVQANSKITCLAADPIQEHLTYTVDGRQIHVCDKKSNNQKYLIKACQKGGDKILGLDFNPNKLCFLMTCHHESIKFWDIRKPNVPVRCYDDHHNLLTQAKYNRSHDQLIACSYDDGTVGLLRLHSVCSSPQTEVQDTMVKLYDEHEDSVYQVLWSTFSPWIFASVSYNASNLVINIVPNVQKYRILL